MTATSDESVQPAVTGVRVDVGFATATGRRDSNEDSVLAEGGVYVVADGMGGHDAGEVASATAVETLRGLVGTVPELSEVVDVLRGAHERVRDLPSRSSRRPGTTVTGVVLTEHEGQPCWIVLNVGDSRTYRMVGGVLEQITTDHSEIALLVARGLVPADVAARHPRRHVVTRVLGGGASAVEPDVWLFPVSPGDRMLACSDGLTDELTDRRIEAELRAADGAQEAADRLVAAALSAGGHDNVTVVVVDATVPRR